MFTNIYLILFVIYNKHVRKLIKFKYATVDKFYSVVILYFFRKHCQFFYIFHEIINTHTRVTFVFILAQLDVC